MGAIIKTRITQSWHRAERKAGRVVVSVDLTDSHDGRIKCATSATVPEKDAGITAENMRHQIRVYAARHNIPIEA